MKAVLYKRPVQVVNILTGFVLILVSALLSYSDAARIYRIGYGYDLISGAAGLLSLWAGVEKRLKLVLAINVFLAVFFFFATILVSIAEYGGITRAMSEFMFHLRIILIGTYGGLGILFLVNVVHVWLDVNSWPWNRSRDIIDEFEP